MKSTFVILLIFVAACLARTTWEQLGNYTFEQYKQEFSRQYSSKAEELMRKMVFEKRLRGIIIHNQDPTKTWKEGVNKFTDRTIEELKAMRGYNKNIAAKWPHNREAGYNYEKPLAAIQLPNSVDWRTKGIMTAVKDQGECGSCWTFGSTESIECYYALKHGAGTVTDLSEQQVLDCTPNPDDCGGTGGCGGGTPEIVYAQMMKTGITTEWMYPYTSYFGQNYNCHFPQNGITPYAHLKNFTKLPSNSYDAVMNAVATVGPLAINVMASGWFNYESGVYNGCPQTGVDIDHVVLLVGYGTDSKGTDYWLVRNSWSPGWGEDGYIRLMRHTTSFCGIDYRPQDGTGCNRGPTQVTVCGECGLLYDVSYPIVN